MTYALYLDDVRIPPKSIGFDIIVRSYDEFFEAIDDYGVPNEISFDHDLGKNVPTGYDIAKEFVKRDMDGTLVIPKDFKFYVHSMNPVGAKNIREYLNSYLNFKNSS